MQYGSQSTEQNEENNTMPTATYVRGYVEIIVGDLC